MSDIDPIQIAADHIANKESADVLFINAPITYSLWDKVRTVLDSANKRKNVYLLLVTGGGDPDAAYKIARCLQKNYEMFTAFVTGYCKSAGTICAVGAHHLIMSDCGELGPLDVQYYKRDELGELNSGLLLPKALDTLRDQMFRMFEQYMLSIKEQSDNMITFRTATDIATKMAIGFYEPILKQIEPLQIGEVYRAMAIAKSYGLRLAINSKNIKPGGLDHLIEHYPSHGFVIDLREAKLLFNNVRAANAEEISLVNSLGDYAIIPTTGNDVRFVSSELKVTQNDQTQASQRQPRVRTQRAKKNSSRRKKKGTVPAPGSKS